MRARRLPTGGLVSLAVVLAALAVVVVAGAPPARTRVVVERQVTTREVRVPIRSHQRAPRPGLRIVVVDTSPASADHGAGAASPPRARTGATTTTTPVTTTKTPPVTTTTTAPPKAAALPSSRDGVFEGGATTASVWVDAVRAVTVVVPSGIEVTLTVTCGLVTASATQMTTATVHVESGGEACTATFSIPASAPQPARWRLSTR